MGKLHHIPRIPAIGGATSPWECQAYLDFCSSHSARQFFSLLAQGHGQLVSVQRCWAQQGSPPPHSWSAPVLVVGVDVDDAMGVLRCAGLTGGGASSTIGRELGHIRGLLAGSDTYRDPPEIGSLETRILICPHIPHLTMGCFH